MNMLKSFLPGGKEGDDATNQGTARGEENCWRRLVDRGILILRFCQLRYLTEWNCPLTNGGDQWLPPS